MGAEQGIGALSGVGVRWTIGDVSGRGFEALRLSVWGAWRVFGPRARYVVCVNNVPLPVARSRTGPLPADVEWRDATRELPAFLHPLLGPGMAQGTGWKLAPLRCFPGLHEVSLDNDCILWSAPQALRDWLADGSPARCLMAEDVRACYGQFAPQCPGRPPCNAGIRGLPPGFDLEAALREAIARREQASGAPLVFDSELDEQGLQVAALSTARPLDVVPLRDVTVCSPFHPHLPELGRCGAHFVGLNARTNAWNYYERPADEWMADHWARHRPTLYERTGAPRLEAIPSV